MADTCSILKIACLGMPVTKWPKNLHMMFNIVLISDVLSNGENEEKPLLLTQLF